ncbi:Cytochrome d ubiquinol oxidase subunit II [Microbacterium esteraromaticum]|uniref:Cytochrome d ubiquinol oxidase subunit II n=1 Tax=Microbacterium esteraromaticum TaxID=57043 RepID=A0A1R4KF54_9MICO|nr:cytochrome d ubiquinol oxidase subunit II [Microbacterium esteraromaticum]SJN42897.1 Cytochrome d ubiquinol oxidase subunit II [Microbacterium esteraromaticum]
MEPLPIVWFIAIAVLWIGYILLEGFDLGVGMHMIFSTRSERDRRVMLNTIGPVWDGNEVWLITAGAALFAAFPAWYAALFSTLYVPLTIMLVGLIVRAVGIEYRGKVASQRWATTWTYLIGIGSLITAFCIGAALALTSTGLPIDANGDRVGGPFVWLTPPAILGGVAVVGFALAHSATFLGLKADGPVRERAADFAARWAPLCLLPAAAWAVWVQIEHDAGVVSWMLIALAVVGLVYGWISARRRREGFAFIGYAAFGLFGVAAIFTGMFPHVLPSTVDPGFDLTIWNAANSNYTLGVMTVVAAFSLPVILLYQAWSYWIFRQRVTPGMIPEVHIVLPAVLRDPVR